MGKMFEIINDFGTTIINSFTVSDFLVVVTAIISASISIWSIKKYYKNTSRDVLSIIKKHRKDLWDDMINNPVDKIPVAPYITPDGEEIEQYEPVWDEELQQKVKECDMQINSYYKQISVLENKLEELRNYITE